MKIYKMDTSSWHIVRVIFLIASFFIAISIVLAVVTGYQFWLLLAGVVALMQFVFALVGYCPLAIALDKIGVPKS